ncbi:MAG: hypothetical protein EON51_16685, partial [Acinetobacter sp.]
MYPIVMLHHVDDTGTENETGWSITHQKFIDLLDCIEEQGLITTTFEELYLSKAKPSKNKVIITFDDCYQSLFTFAIPELIRRKMKAVFYIPTAFIGGYNEWDVKEQGFNSFQIMNGGELLYLSNLGMEIGSHGHSHLRHNLITEQKLVFELSHSKQILEKLLKKPVFSFAHPYGIVPKKIDVLLTDAGFHYGVAIYQAMESNSTLRRFGIHQSDTKKSIKFKLSKRYQLFRLLLDPVLHILA